MRLFFVALLSAHCRDYSRTETLSLAEELALAKSDVIEPCRNCARQRNDTRVYHIENGADWDIVDQVLAPLRECPNSITGGQQF